MAAKTVAVASQYGDCSQLLANSSSAMPSLYLAIELSNLIYQPLYLADKAQQSWFGQMGLFMIITVL